jgi:hypothetical protein
MHFNGSTGSNGGSRRNGERHPLGHTGRVDVLAALDVGTSGVFLRRARPGDVAAIVGLLAADQLGAVPTRIASTSGSVSSLRMKA